MEFDDIIKKLEKRFKDFTELASRAKNEAEIINILSSILFCDSEVVFKEIYPELIVDLICDDFAIEVEFNKQPHEGIHQAIAYKVFLNKESAIIHIVDYCSEKYRIAFEKILKSLKTINIRGAIISISTGEIFVF